MPTRKSSASAPLTFDLPLSLISKIEAYRKTRGMKTSSEVIRLALLTLEGKTGKSIESVRVDTRNFANLETEIWLTEEKRRCRPRHLKPPLRRPNAS